MLMMERREGHGVIIKRPDGSEVVIKVLEVKGDLSVRLEVDAPQDCSVHRDEIYERLYPLESKADLE